MPRGSIWMETKKIVMLRMFFNESEILSGENDENVDARPKIIVP